MPNDESTQNSVSFEAAYKRLDEIACLLEDSTTPLEKSFALFEEGQKLLRTCQDILDKAEKRLKVIQVRPDGYDVEEQDIG